MRHVGRQCFVAFLISLILLDIMKVITSKNNSSLHLHALDNPSQNTASNTDITSERTFLVNVGAFCCFSWCFESQANVFHKPLVFSFGSFSNHSFLVLEDGSLLLISPFCLFRHDDGIDSNTLISVTVCKFDIFFCPM